MNRQQFVILLRLGIATGVTAAAIIDMRKQRKIRAEIKKETDLQINARLKAADTISSKILAGEYDRSRSPFEEIDRDYKFETIINREFK